MNIQNKWSWPNSAALNLQWQPVQSNACFLMGTVLAFKLLSVFSFMRLSHCWVSRLSGVAITLICRLYMQIYFCPNTGIACIAECRTPTLAFGPILSPSKGHRFFDGSFVHLPDPYRHMEEAFVDPSTGFNFKRQIALCVQSSDSWQQTMSKEPRK